MPERKPKTPRPKGIIPQYSVEHRVKDEETWKTLSERYGIPEDEIIYANFWTLVPEEVNWYLHYYVGCKSTRDGRNRRFTSDAKPGIIYIPPQKYTFPPDTILGTLPPRYYTVTVPPSKWSPPPGLTDDGISAKKVVSEHPWRRASLTIGGQAIRTRADWKADDPKWENELIYYNTVRSPLPELLTSITVHHTDNSDSIKVVERDQKGKGYAALGYHFFIDKSGTIFEGRPLEVMGSNSGEGKTPGPINDPDWGAIGITMQGDYHGAGVFNTADDVPKAQLQALENLVVSLRKDFRIARLLMHREIVRKGEPTDCPGDEMVPHVEALRKKLALPGL